MPLVQPMRVLGTAVHSPHPAAINTNIKNESYNPIIECDEHMSIKVNICGNNAEIGNSLMIKKERPSRGLRYLKTDKVENIPLPCLVVL